MRNVIAGLSVHTRCSRNFPTEFAVKSTCGGVSLQNRGWPVEALFVEDPSKKAISAGGDTLDTPLCSENVRTVL